MREAREKPENSWGTAEERAGEKAGKAGGTEEELRRKSRGPTEGRAGGPRMPTVCRVDRLFWRWDKGLWDGALHEPYLNQ